MKKIGLVFVGMLLLASVAYAKIYMWNAPTHNVDGTTISNDVVLTYNVYVGSGTNWTLLQSNVATTSVNINAGNQQVAVTAVGNGEESEKAILRKPNPPKGLSGQ